MFDVFLDRFEEVEPLVGAPEAGEVSRAFDPERRQPVLLRVLPAGPYEIPAVDHPCVRRVLDTFEADGWRVLVEEWVEGETLDRWMERAATVPLEVRIGWLVSLAEALMTAHEADVVHGALAPAWIAVPDPAEPKLAGLGVGALLHGMEASPEDDAFAFGLLAYELLTGRLPFSASSAEEVRQRLKAHQRYVPASDLEADVPREIDFAIERCLVPLDLHPPRGGYVGHAPDRGWEIMPWSRRNPGLRRFTELGRLPIVDRSLGPGAPSAIARPPLYDDNVQFTVYRPRSVPSEGWSRLLFFAHLDALPGDAEEGETDPVEKVEETARRLLGDEARTFRESVQDSLSALPREGEITVVPEIDGVRFNPPSVTFLWLESVHWHEFRLRPERRLAGTVSRGRIVVRHGAILLADIPLRLAVDRPEAVASSDPVPSERETARAYRSIFPSYSHRDTEVVEQFERYGTAIGDRYLRDVVALRSGEAWNPRLIELIEEADVFQLFWSSHSMGSPYVEQEWRHALGLGRSHFVRPVYWQRPLPEDQARGLPTEELRALHFHFLGGTEVAPERRGAPFSPDDEIEELDTGGTEPERSTGQDLPIPPSPPKDFTFSSGRSRGRGWLAAAGVVLAAGLAFVTFFQVAGPAGGPQQGSTDLSSEDGGARVATVPVVARGGEESLDLSEEQIRTIREVLAASPETELVIEGHVAAADRSNEVDLALGEVRATAVRDQLIELGVPSDQVFTISYGEERPICTEDTEECRERNDRVEILALAPDPDALPGGTDRERPKG
jgi:hypothetical protein